MLLSLALSVRFEANPRLHQERGPPSTPRVWLWRVCAAAREWVFSLWISANRAAPAGYNRRLSPGTSPHMRADLWQRGCERLATELPDQQFNTWIRPLPEAEVADLGDAGATVTIRVPNRFKLDWIRTQYAGRIETALSELAGKPVRLDLTLATRDAAGRSSAPASVATGTTVARAV